MLARIPVDDGLYCLGIMDEMNVLEYGQVFLQRRLPDGTVKPLLGKIVVSRSPALHPGDIRVLDAVDTEESREKLSHYIDCIVFPQRGERPHPHECSGGDLDGDTFLCLWGERWIPSIQDTAPFGAHETIDTGTVSKDDNTVDVPEVRQFFVDYIYEDKLGNIADAHVRKFTGLTVVLTVVQMYHADKSDKGVFDPVCLELARWHNIAVDAPKTGKQVPNLDCMKIPEYPDHACPTSLSRTYPSQKILGKLYRMADEQVTLMKSLTRSRACLVAQIDPDLIVPGYQEHLEWAAQLLSSYNVQFKNFISQFEMGDQFQAISGDAMWEKKGQRREWENMRDGVESILQQVRSQYRGVIFEACGQDEKALRKRASACYCATYSAAQRDCEVSITFPWLLDDILCRIKGEARAAAKSAQLPPSSEVSSEASISATNDQESLGSMDQAAVEATSLPAPRRDPGGAKLGAAPAVRSDGASHHSSGDVVGSSNPEPNIEARGGPFG